MTWGLVESFLAERKAKQSRLLGAVPDVPLLIKREPRGVTKDAWSRLSRRKYAWRHCVKRVVLCRDMESLRLPISGSTRRAFQAAVITEASNSHSARYAAQVGGRSHKKPEQCCKYQLEALRAIIYLSQPLGLHRRHCTVKLRHLHAHLGQYLQDQESVSKDSLE